MKQVDPGKYRHKVTFLHKVKGKDKYGEPFNSWEPFKQGIWASKDPLLGNEYFTALTVDSKVEVKFNMRYIPGITNEMRIEHGEEVYEILSAVNVKELNRELLCYCRLVK
ncbi:MAG TPA: phage head closure protein [Epulopiscium sp.]|nr:phage head closure protein [Candidatus Epulonipiscium sp.]